MWFGDGVEHYQKPLGGLLHGKGENPFVVKTMVRINGKMMCGGCGYGGKGLTRAEGVTIRSSEKTSVTVIGCTIGAEGLA